MESNTIKDSKDSKQDALKIYLGSYEGKVFSVTMDIKSKSVDSFSFKVSDNSIKTILLHGGEYIFVSGVDEIVHIFNMKTREEKGNVVTYAGTVSILEISKNYLFTAGDDMNIAMWRMSDFSQIHNLKGHKAAITHFTIHKSAKFCLSASKDNSLIIWNLLKGTKIIKYNFKNGLVCKKILMINQEKLAVLIFEQEMWLFDMFKDTEKVDEYVVKKIKLENKIFDAFSSKNKVIIVDNTGDLLLFENFIESDEFKKISIEKPQTPPGDDLPIRIKHANIAKSNKFKLFNVVFSNNEIYIYDLNKILKPADQIEDNILLKKYRSIVLKTADRITCIDSYFI